MLALVDDRLAVLLLVLSACVLAVSVLSVAAAVSLSRQARRQAERAREFHDAIGRLVEGGRVDLRPGRPRP